METLKETIDTFATSTVKCTATKIEQKQRNQMRTQLLETLRETLATNVNGENCEVLLTEKGVTLVISNNKMDFGGFSIELTPVFKNFDFDPYESEKEKQHLQALAKERVLKRREIAMKRSKLQAVAREKQAKLNAKYKR